MHYFKRNAVFQSFHLSHFIDCVQIKPVFKGLIPCILTALFVVPFSGSALAAPEGGEVVGGQGQISQTNSNTTIQQQSNSLAIDWQGFNVDSHETVSFQQPSSSSVVLNRIFDQNPTQIFGTIEANGRVFLSNPNGLVFGQSATINVGSFVASGLDMNVDDFMQGRYRFSAAEGQAGGIVINRGLITAATRGSVSLIGGAVSNEGVIVANLGQVNLGAGRKAVIDFDGDGLINFAVSENLIENTSGLSAAVNNSGQIKADGGQVLLTATAAQGVFKHVVNNDGIIEAGRIDNSGGLVRLLGIGSDPVIHSGVIDVSGRDGQSTGGTVHVLGEKVGLFEKAEIYASGDMGGGTVLIGGDFQGKNQEIQNASQTIVSRGAQIQASATGTGDGGKVIVWANDLTRYYGDIEVRGGPDIGNGGFVEVSGAEHLSYDGSVDLSAGNGISGELLLDPVSLTILEIAPGSFDTDALFTADQTIDFSDTVGADSISVAAIEGISSGTVTLQARELITINDLNETTGDGIINLQPNVDLVMETRNDSALSDGSGGIRFIDSTNQIIATGNGTIRLTAGTVGTAGDPTLQNIGSLSTTGQDITLQADGDITMGGSIGTGGTGSETVSITSTSGNVSLAAVDANALNVTGGVLRLNGDLSVDTNLDLRTNVSSITLAGNSTIDTAAGGIDQSISLAGVTGDFNLTLTGDSGSAVTLGAIDTNALNVNGGVLRLNGDLSVDTNLDLRTNVSSITLAGNSTIDIAAGGIDQAISLAGVSGDFDLTLRGDSGSAVTLGAVDTNALNVTGGVLTLNGGLTVDTNLDLRTNVSSIALAGNSTIDTAAGGVNQLISLADVSGDFNLTVSGDSGSNVILNVVDTNALNVSGLLRLDGDIFVDTNLDLRTNVVSIIFLDDSVITIDTAAGGVNQSISLAFVVGGSPGGNGTDLSINAGSGAVTLDTVVNVKSLSVTTMGQTTLGGNISARGSGGVNLSGASNVDLTTAVFVNTTTGNGVVNLSGGAVDGNKALTINAGSGTVTLGAMGQNVALNSLNINSGATILGGNIKTQGASGIDLSGASSFSLSGPVVIDTTTGDGELKLGSGAIKGGHDLEIKTGSKGIILGGGGDFRTLTLETNGSVNIGGPITSTGDISIAARDLNLSGPGSIRTSDAESGIITITENNNGGGIALGNLILPLLGMRISGLELNSITAGNLTLSTQGLIRVNTVTEQQSDTIKTVTLEANGGKNSSIAFISGTSTFNALTAKADDGIAVDVEIKTIDTDPSPGRGDLILDADANNTSDGNDSFTFGGASGLGGLTFAGDLKLSATSSTTGITLSDNFIFNSKPGNGDIDLGDVAINGNGMQPAPSLSVIAGGGKITLGNIGLINRLSSVTVNTSGTTGLKGSIRTSTAAGIDLSGSNDVVLLKDVILDTSVGNGNVNLSATPLNGKFSLTVNANNGTVNFGDIGQTTALNDLQVSSAGNANLAGNIKTQGQAGVDLSAVTKINLDRAVTIDTAINNSPIRLGMVDGPFKLTLNAVGGEVALGSVGQTSPLASLIVSGNRAVLNGQITTQGSAGIDFSSLTNITLTNDTILNTQSNNGVVNLGTAVVNGNRNLEIRAGTGVVSLGSMGETTALASFIVSSASRINLGNSTTTFNTLGNINLAAAPLEGNSHLIISAGSGDVSFSAIGQSEALGSLAVTTSGTTTLNGDIKTQQVGGLDLSNSANVVLDSTLSITIDTINNNGVVKLEGGQVDGAVDLIVNAGGGKVTLGNMGQTTALTSLDINTTGLTTLTGNIKTQGAGGIVLTDATNITLSGTLALQSTAANGKIHLDGGVVDGNAALVLDASTGAVKLGATGQNTALTSLSVSAGTLVLGGNVTAQGGIDLGSAGPTSLTGNVVLNSAGGGGDTRLVSVDGNFSLTVNTGSGGAALGALGQNDALAGLTLISSGQTALGGDIKTQGAGGIDLSQALDVDLTTAVVIDTSAGNGPVLLNGGAIDGGFALTVNSGEGDITFDGVGLNSPLASLSITNSGVQSYNDDFFVSGPLTMSGGSIAQNAGLNSTGGPIRVEAASDITIAGASNGGAITYTANGGSITQNGDLNSAGGPIRVEAASDITIAGATNGGEISYTANGGSITQNADLNSAGGPIAVQAASGITMGSAAATLSNGGEITYTAATGDVLLGLLDANTGNVTVDTSGGGSILNNRGESIDITGDLSSHMNIKGNVASLRSAERIGISSTNAITLDVPDKVTLAFGAEKAYIRSIQDSIVVVEGAGEVIDVIKDSRDANRRSESAIRQQFPVEASKGSQSQSHLFTVSSPGFGTATEMGTENEIAILNPVVPSMVRTTAGWRFLWDSQDVEGTNIRPVSDLDEKDREKRSQERQKHDKEIDERFEEGFKYPTDPFSSKGKGR